MVIMIKMILAIMKIVAIKMAMTATITPIQRAIIITKQIQIQIVIETILTITLTTKKKITIIVRDHS